MSRPDFENSNYDLLIKNGSCAVTAPDGSVRLEKTNIGVKNGKIQSIGLAGSVKAARELDATHLTVLPGVIDSQVHFREPGMEHKEDLYSGTLSAITGGVTTIFEMPNTKPNTSTQARLDEKLRLAEGKAKCNFAFFVGATNDNTDRLEDIAATEGCVGVKIFMGSSTGDLLVADDATLERILKKVRRPISVHCEDEFILKDRYPIAEQGAHARVHYKWRNVDSALTATRRIVNLAKKAGRKVHVLHISSGDEMAFLRDNKQHATVECLPQFLTFSAPEIYERLGSYAQMNPPIREKHHQDALWKAIADGTVDVLGTDHAPHTRGEKQKPYPLTPSGMTGVQTLIPVMLTHVAQKRLSLERFVQLVGHNPARIFRAKSKGHIAPGYDADFSIVDLKRQQTISNSWVRSKAGWTPYDGFQATGWPVMALLAGEMALRDGAVFSQAIGRKVQFH